MEEIETERLRLRALEERDAEPIAELVSDFEIAKMLAQVPYPYTIEDARGFIRRAGLQMQEGSSLVYAIDREHLIGCVGLSEIQMIEGEKIATLGYWLGRPYWGRGLATEATRALVAHAFARLGFAGLKSGHFKENSRSGRVLAKAGFRYAGEGIKACMARGTDVPHIDVVLTRSQWEEFAARLAA